MEAALAKALEWLDRWRERDGTTGRTTKEDYEEKLMEVEEVCGPIIKQVGRRGWGHGAGWACAHGVGLASGERRIDNRARMDKIEREDERWTVFSGMWACVRTSGK